MRHVWFISSTIFYVVAAKTTGDRMQRKLAVLCLFCILKDCYIHFRHISCSNALISYRVLLTIMVAVTSEEIRFLKQKLLKFYLRSTMSQERLNELAIMTTEK